MSFIERTSTNGLNLLGGLSDWVPPGGNGHGVPTPAPETSAFYALLDTKHMVEMATALGEEEDAAKYTAMLVDGKSAYHKQFYNSTTKVYSAGSQCSAMMALWIGAVPAPLEAEVLAGLASNIRTAYGGNHLDTGAFSPSHSFYFCCFNLGV